MSLSPTAPTEGPPQAPARSFVHHAKLISLLTLASRILGVVRESLAARYFGAKLVTDAFTLAFAMPNLFRRLFGEGALSVAFIPLYSQSLRSEQADEARKFATASVNLLIFILLALTVAGEALLWSAAWLFDLRPDHLLAVQLTGIMFPYVLLVCGAAFLGAILQVHRRFGMTAFLPVVLNLALIVSTVLGALFWDTSTEAGRVSAIYFVSASVVVAGVIQVALLIGPLRQIGFRFNLRETVWTPAVRRMLKLSIPVAVGAGVLQISVVIDKLLAFFLAQGIDDSHNLVTHFTLFGQSIAYPLERGAAVRLSWAQMLYQFPLGVFAIAVATAIFPALSANAMDTDRAKFRSVLHRGIQVTIWEGFPATVGLMIVAVPLVQVIFEGGRFTQNDTAWVAQSLQFYALGIWALSLLQIVSRAYYALHDPWTPLLMAVVTLVVNIVVELPLMWTGMKESGMAVGTAASFIAQVAVSLWFLQRKTGDLQLRSIAAYSGKVLLATAVMAGACYAIQHAPFFPEAQTRSTALVRLVLLVTTGAATYLGITELMGVGIRSQFRR